MIHELKIKPEYFAAVVSGDKTFEIRNNADRNFKVGDTLLLWEWDEGLTSQTAERTVSYITDFEQKPGYVVLGLANKREQELAEQLADATRQCGVMAELLREVTKIVPAIGVAIDDLPVVDVFLERIEAVLAGKLPDRQNTEWTDAATSPVAADYRELQEQHDQLQSKHKGALDLLHESHEVMRRIIPPLPQDCANRSDLLDRIEVALAGKQQNKPVTITETIRTAPERIWLQVGDQSGDGDYPFPEHHDEVTWCADSVAACEVPYVRADLVGHSGHPLDMVPVGQQLIYIGEIEVSHKWWLNCKSEFFSPIDGADFSDWPDGINKLFRIAASPKQQGGEPCAIEPRSSSPA